MTFRALPGAAVIGESVVAPEACVLQRLITTRKGAPISDTGHSILERSVVSVPAPETYAVTLDGLGFATWTVPLFAASQLCWHVLRQRYTTGTLLHEFTRVATDVLSRDTNRYPDFRRAKLDRSPTVRPATRNSYREEHCTLGFVATCAGCSPASSATADLREQTNVKTVHAR